MRRTHPILREISLEIKPGQTVALVGGTGAGKTTLLSLVPRFYDPGSGRVRIDGIDVRDATKKSLRANISVVLQDTLLLSGTVLENIAYGRPEATPRRDSRRRRSGPGATPSSRNCRAATTRRSASGACGSAAARSSASASRAPSSRTRRSCCSTSRPARSTSRPRRKSWTRCMSLMRRYTTLIVTHRLSTITMSTASTSWKTARGRIGHGPELLARNGVYARLWNAARQEGGGRRRSRDARHNRRAGTLSLFLAFRLN